MITQEFKLSSNFRDAFIPEYIAPEVFFCTDVRGGGYYEYSRRYPALTYLSHVQMTFTKIWFVSNYTKSRRYEVPNVISFNWGAIRSYCASLKPSSEASTLFREIPLIVWTTPPDQQEAVLHYFCTYLKHLSLESSEWTVPIFYDPDYQRAWVASVCMICGQWPWISCANWPWINTFREDSLVSAFL